MKSSSLSKMQRAALGENIRGGSGQNSARQQAHLQQLGGHFGPGCTGHLGLLLIGFLYLALPILEGMLAQEAWDRVGCHQKHSKA